MNKYGFLVGAIVLASFVGCFNGNGSSKGEDVDSANVNDELTDSTLDEETESIGRSLNDIRFDGWEDSDWYDNDYIRTVREYIDDFCLSKVENADLEPYKEYVNCQFGICGVSPFIAGGLFIRIAFLDLPDRIFASWVYSGVDEDTEQVVSYELRSIKIEEEKIDFTKEDILRIAREHPEVKLLW